MDSSGLQRVASPFFVLDDFGEENPELLGQVLHRL